MKCPYCFSLLTVGKDSYDGFFKEIESLGCNVNEGVGLARQLKDSMLRAAETAGKEGIVLYLEGDKEKWVKERLSDSLEQYNALPTKQRGLTLIARDREKMATFPSWQREWEGRFNKSAAAILGLPEAPEPYDFVYGPKFIISDLAQELKIFSEADLDSMKWEPLLSLTGNAAKPRLPLNFFYTASECPESQRQEKTKNIESNNAKIIFLVFLEV